MGHRLPTAGEALPGFRRQPDEVDLFLYSSALNATHRIHYDRDHARREGLADLAVQGPLMGAYLEDVVQTWARARGGRLVRLRYRNLRTMVVGAPLECGGHVTSADPESAEVECELWVDDATGERATLGRATVRFAVR